MRTLAEQIVAEDPTKLPEGETAVTQENYFSIISDTYIGQKQEYQFQPSGVTGKIWGSLYKDSDGNTKSAEKIDATAGQTISIGGTTRKVGSNANAEMPRSYHRGNNSYGGYYNWYAAAAESGTYTTTTSTAEDSVCPSGWRLATHHGSNINSWWYLIARTYDILKKVDGNPVQGESNQSASKAMREQPLLFAFSMHYNWSSGTIPEQNTSSRGSYWSSYAGNDSGKASALIFSGSGVYPQYFETKTFGFNTRCVKK